MTVQNIRDTVFLFTKEFHSREKPTLTGQVKGCDLPYLLLRGETAHFAFGDKVSDHCYVTVLCSIVKRRPSMLVDVHRVSIVLDENFHYV